MIKLFCMSVFVMMPKTFPVSQKLAFLYLSFLFQQACNNCFFYTTWVGFWLLQIKIRTTQMCMHTQVQAVWALAWVIWGTEKHAVLMRLAYIRRYTPSSRYLRHMQTNAELSVHTRKCRWMLSFRHWPTRASTCQALDTCLNLQLHALLSKCEITLKYTLNSWYGPTHAESWWNLHDSWDMQIHAQLLILAHPHTMTHICPQHMQVHILMHWHAETSVHTLTSW